jgi:hypothetical protein
MKKSDTQLPKNPSCGILSSVKQYFAARNKSRDFKILKHLENNSESRNAKECYAAKMKSKKHQSFLIQKIVFFDISNKMNLFEYYCKGKKVLHIGCTDYPVFDPKNNLHIKLSELASELHGMDIDVEGTEALKQYVDQPYFNSLADATDSYDVCLVPEVIEHVDNISLFLKDVEKINAKLFIIAAPNAFGQYYRNLNFFKSGKLSIEIEHPDHNCYFSPYTLKNAIQKYSCLEVSNILLSSNHNNQKSVFCVCRKTQKS